MASLTSTRRPPASSPPTGSGIARPEDVYGDVGSVMADVAAHDGANQAQGNVIVSSCEVCHLRRRPARPLAATRTLSSTFARTSVDARSVERTLTEIEPRRPCTAADVMTSDDYFSGWRTVSAKAEKNIFFCHTQKRYVWSMRSHFWSGSTSRHLTKSVTENIKVLSPIFSLI